MAPEGATRGGARPAGSLAPATALGHVDCLARGPARARGDPRRMPVQLAHARALGCRLGRAPDRSRHTLRLAGGEALRFPPPVSRAFDSPPGPDTRGLP